MVIHTLTVHLTDLHIYIKCLQWLH